MGKTFEFQDSFPIKVDIDRGKRSLILSDADNALKSGASLVCSIDATHSGTLINNRIYPPDKMAKGAATWTKPFKKPVLVNHDADKDPIGRVLRAKYVKTARGAASTDVYKPILKVSDGYGYLQLEARITNRDAIEKILDGRYETVSVRMSTDHAICSICDQDWSVDGVCDHMPGNKYDGKLAYITTGDLTYREVSFVNIPADEVAGVRDLKLEDSNFASIAIYADNPEEKNLSGVGMDDTGNLYQLLDEESGEHDDLVLHLLDALGKAKQSTKEEDVKLEELTRDQLQDHPVVKAIVDEAVKAKETEDAAQCAASKKKLEADLAQCQATKSDSAKLQDEINALKQEVEQLKDQSPVEALKAEVAQLKDEISQKAEDSKTLLDENVKVKADLQKMVAERLFDLKHELGKPDVAGINTPDARSKKVDEFVQRSYDSLNDQVADLLLEKSGAQASVKSSVGDVSNPGAARSDKTNLVDNAPQQRPESKIDRLKRLFSKTESGN